MLEIESFSGSRYIVPTHDGACRTILKALKELEEDNLKLSIDSRYEKIVRRLFETAQKRVKDCLYICLCGHETGRHQRCPQRTSRPATGQQDFMPIETQYFPEELVCHLIRSTIFRVR